MTLSELFGFSRRPEQPRGDFNLAAANARLNVINAMRLAGELEPKWTLWSGGSCPVDPDDKVEVWQVDGERKTQWGGLIVWTHVGSRWDTIAYRLKPPQD